MVNLKYYLVINPAAHAGKSRKKIKEILSYFTARGVEFTYEMTKAPRQAVFIAERAVTKGFNIIVAVGGDGTICEVISGLFKTREVSAGVKLGVLHIGTSPDFNRHHNIPVNLSQALEALWRGKSKSVDVGRITYFNRENQKEISYFGSSVNVGLGPFIAGKANSRYRKYLGDFLGTLCATLSSLTRFKGVDLQVAIDGRKVEYQRLINLTVGKDPYLASGMRIFNRVEPNDGRLFIFSVEKRPYFSLLANLPRLYVGNFLNFKGAAIRYGRKVEIFCPDARALVEFDGDAQGMTPLEVDCLPRALEVIS